MRTRIFLENVNLDLYEDLDTTFTYVIDDVKDFGSRNTSFSKTISIPGNTINNKAFGHIFQLGSANDYDSSLPNIGYNFNASVSARCIIFIDQIQVFKGSLRLLEIIDTAGELAYQCFVFGELGGFIFELGNRRLQDLNFSDYNEDYTIANIKNSWNNVNGSGVAYPLIDYGNVSSDKINFQYKAFRPALYVRDYLERIISGTTYNVQSNFFLTTLFDRLVVPYNRKRLDRIDTSYMSATINEQELISFEQNYILSYTGVALGDFTLVGAGFIFQYNGTTPITTDIEFTLTGQIGITYIGAHTQAINLLLQKNNITIDTFNILPLQLVSNIETLDITVKFSNVNLVTGDKIRILIPVTDPNRGNTTIEIEINAGNTIRFTGGTGVAVPINIGEAIPINSVIPIGIFQRDFFIWILKMFNLLVYESQFDEKTIIISTYDEFISNSANTALDWSSKIDREKPITQMPMSELNARFYQYKFKEDNDFFAEDYRKGYNEGYGDFIFDTQFEFSKETDILEIGFSNSVLFKNIGTDKTYPAIYKLSGSTETSMDCNIRILQLKKKDCTIFNILDVASVLDESTAYLYGGHLDDPDTPTNDICFGAPKLLQFTPTSAYPSTNVFNTFHSGYLAEITDKNSKLVIAFAYLNTVDIMNLDFSKLVYVDGVLFRLNKINNYNPIDLGTTEIQLLKVIDI